MKYNLKNYKLLKKYYLLKRTNKIKQIFRLIFFNIQEKKLIYKETQEVSTPKQESLQNKVNNTYIVFMLKHNVGDSISNIV